MKNIVLIGMPGVGKSTIGLLLSKETGMELVDTDLLIQKSEGLPLQQMINSFGTEEFLKREEKAVLGLSQKDSIIATGGSVVYSNNSMMKLKNEGIVIYLYLPLYKIKNRIRNLSTRGIVLNNNKSLEDIFIERAALYDKYSDIKINCKDMKVEKIVSTIIDFSKTYKSL